MSTCVQKYVYPWSVERKDETLMDDLAYELDEVGTACCHAGPVHLPPHQIR